MLELSSDFSPRSVMDEVIEEIQARRNRATEFLNGRNPHDLTDEEFDKLQEISGNNFYNKRNPEHVEIMENYKIFNEREEYLKQANDRTNIGADDHELGLNIREINRYAVSLAELALNWANDRLCSCLVNNTVFVHDRRKLQIQWEHGEIMAEPDEINMSEESMNYRGVTRWGRYAYDLDLDVTIDLREYDDSFMREVFSFYFALKLSQVAFNFIDDFLNYQLEETFKGDFGLFSRFLTLLLREKIRMPYRDSKKAEYSDKEILEVERVESVKEWVHSKMINLNLSLPEEKNEEESNSEFISENWRVIKGQLSPEQIKHVLSFLYKETGNDTDGKAFLTEIEVEELLKYGFAYPKEKRNPPLKLAISTKRTIKTIYYCFYRLYLALDKEYIDKNDIVNFLLNSFENFNIENRQTIYENIKNTRPAKMKFDIDKDYIDKAKQIKPTKSIENTTNRT